MGVYLVGRGSKSPVGVSVATFKVLSSIGEKETFPITTTEFDNKHCQIIRGFSSRLTTNRENHLVLKAPGAKGLRLEVSPSPIPFQRDDGFFKIKYTPVSRGKAVVSGQYGKGEEWTKLLEYEMR